MENERGIRFVHSPGILTRPDEARRLRAETLSHEEGVGGSQNGKGAKIWRN